MKRKFIISGGGTGGHIYPAIAIANELKARFDDAEILFVGAKDKMEMKMVPDAGYKIEGLWISGLSRGKYLENLMLPLKILLSVLKSKRILKNFNPDMAIGTGGYASFPLLRVAASNKIPCVIQEQNSIPGMTNKRLSGAARKIFVAYEGMEKFFPKSKVRLTGNPVRRDLINIQSDPREARQSFGLDADKKTLLILGGSLGAGAINELVKKSLDFFKKNEVQVIWQCGRYYEEKYKSSSNESVKVLAFLNKMDIAYAAADFIISRAGALSVSELCLVGKPVIFIPSPNVAEDHQTHNAMAVAQKDAAIVIKEADLNNNFENEFKALLSSEEKQRKLSENIKALARPDATKHIIDEIESIINSIK